MRRTRKTIERILELKERRQEEIALEVRGVQDRIAFHEAELAALERSYAETLSAYDALQRRGPVEARDVALYYGYLLQLLREMDDRRSRLSRCLDELGERREELIAALRETKTFERLKDRHERAAEREETDRERKEMDRLASARRLP